ncbi:hypothetical protein VC77_13295 [Vibrio cholerae]|nr:hypothetical protein VC77_13295 [Vibrio cholerae]
MNLNARINALINLIIVVILVTTRGRVGEKISNQIQKNPATEKYRGFFYVNSDRLKKEHILNRLYPSSDRYRSVLIRWNTPTNTQEEWERHMKCKHNTQEGSDTYCCHKEAR